MPTIGINGTSHQILCGLCDAPVSERVNANGDAEFGCVVCENWADQQQLVDIVTQYTKDEGQMIINRLARDAASKSKIMTFKGKTVSDRTHRFKVASLKI